MYYISCILYPMIYFPGPCFDWAYTGSIQGIPWNPRYIYLVYIGVIKIGVMRETIGIRLLEWGYGYLFNKVDIYH